MPLKEDHYDCFKEDLIRNTMTLTPSDLSVILEEYASVINSKRRSSCIQNFGELISVLEKRGHISADNITPLTNIINRLPNQDKRNNMLARLNQSHERPSMPSPSMNQYAQPMQTPFYPYNIVEYPNAAHRQNYDKYPGILSDAVVELISSEIGRKWKDLARKLKLREGDINTIQSRHTNPSDDTVQCAQECLQLYQSRCDRYELEKNLITALEKVRRVDLRNAVQKLLDRRDS